MYMFIQALLYIFKLAFINGQILKVHDLYFQDIINLGNLIKILLRLNYPSVRKWQAKIAKAYGIYGFVIIITGLREKDY